MFDFVLSSAGGNISLIPYSILYNALTLNGLMTMSLSSLAVTQPIFNIIGTSGINNVITTSFYTVINFIGQNIASFIGSIIQAIVSGPGYGTTPSELKEFEFYLSRSTILMQLDFPYLDKITEQFYIINTEKAIMYPKIKMLCDTSNIIRNSACIADYCKVVRENVYIQPNDSGLYQFECSNIQGLNLRGMIEIKADGTSKYIDVGISTTELRMEVKPSGASGMFIEPVSWGLTTFWAILDYPVLCLSRICFKDHILFWDIMKPLDLQIYMFRGITTLHIIIVILISFFILRKIILKKPIKK